MNQVAGTIIGIVLGGTIDGMVFGFLFDWANKLEAILSGEMYWNVWVAWVGVVTLLIYFPTLFGSVGYKLGTSQ